MPSTRRGPSLPVPRFHRHRSVARDVPYTASRTTPSSATACASKNILCRPTACCAKTAPHSNPVPRSRSRSSKEPGWFPRYRQPIYYKANRWAVVGTEEDVLWPACAEIVDYELEFGFFVSKGGRDIPKEQAREHIFGYAVFNDVSARDIQAVEMTGGLGRGTGKDFDTANVIGPCIVTADELDLYDCVMAVRINGEEWARGHSGGIHWTFEDLIIAHVSRLGTLFPGEFSVPERGRPRLRP